MDAFPKKPKKKKPVLTYPWSLDEDAVETADSLALAESMVKHKLDKEAVRDGGMGMVFHYDVDARERGWDLGPSKEKAETTKKADAKPGKTPPAGPAPEATA